MDELMWLRMAGGGFSTGIDITALIAFIAFAVIYLIIPLLGYRPEKPTGIAISLYLLLGYGGLSMLQVLAQWFQITGSITSPGGMRGGQEGIHVLFVFVALKLLVFLLAMVMFVVALHSLRWRRSESESPFDQADELERLREENYQLRRRLAEGGGRRGYTEEK